MKKKWRKFINSLIIIIEKNWRKFINLLIIIEKKWRKFITAFKPTYKVDITMYHFIPGMPVKANRTRHSFKKGEFEAAKLFFQNASEKTRDVNMAPVEIDLVRGKRKVISRRHFGPVKKLKQMRMSA